MKKLSVILIVFLFMPMLAFAQLQIHTHKEKISDFPQKITYVVLTGNDSLDVPVREAVKNFWTISAYEICSQEEFESLRKDDKYYFLAVGPGAEGLRSWYLVKGGSYDKRKGLPSMLTVASVPICPADGLTGREDTLLPALLCNLQYAAGKAVRSNYTGIGGAESSLKAIKDLPIYLCEGELAPEIIGIASQESYIQKNIRVLLPEELDAAFYTGDQAIICFVVGPKNPVPGQSFYVYLVDASSYTLHYKKRHKVSRSSGMGLLKEDLNAFAKGR